MRRFAVKLEKFSSVLSEIAKTQKISSFWEKNIDNVFKIHLLVKEIESETKY